LVNKGVGHGKTCNGHARKDKDIYLIENPEAKRSLGKPRCRRVDINKMDLIETARECGLDSSRAAWELLVG
jgi:hypothetical protein